MKAKNKKTKVNSHILSGFTFLINLKRKNSKFIGIYRNDFENQLFEELKNSTGALEENIEQDKIETNSLTKYIYYIRLIRKLFKENPVGEYNILTCKYKNSRPKDIDLLLLLKMKNNNFSYILSSQGKKICEMPIKELKQKIQDSKKTLILYNKPYKTKIGPLTKEESSDILKGLDRD